MKVLDRPEFREILRRVFKQRSRSGKPRLKLRVVCGRAEVSFGKANFMQGNTKLEVLHGGVSAAVLDSVAGIARRSCASSDT